MRCVKSQILTVVVILVLASCAPKPVEGTTDTLTPGTTYLPPTPTTKPTSTRIRLPTSTPTYTLTATSTLPPSVRPDYDNISGTYSLKRSDGGWCVIKVIMEPREKPIDEIGFEIFCIRGAPSYNSGYGLARIRLARNVAVYSYSDSYSHSPNCVCNIVLEFQNQQIEVTQIGLDFECGFGATIDASGTYSIIDDKPPVLGCMRMDNPCNLQVPIPE